jgi:D-alanyl-D-alanine carboxypeptidase
LIEVDMLLAIREEGGIFSHCDPGVRPLYSLTKSYIAAAVFVLDIDIRRSVADWISPDWLPGGKDIRVEHLLNHTSGLSDYGALPAYRQAIADGHPPWSDETFAGHTLHRPLLFEPGSGFAYSNPGYWLLGRILERKAERDLASVLDETIFQPLALQETRMVSGQFANDLPGYPAEWVWHGLLVGSARDSAEFMASDLITPLRARLTPVPGNHPPWRAPHYGFGLMTEPGELFGNNGGGPGYSAACYRFESSGRTLCLLARGATDQEALTRLLTVAADDG